MRRWRSVARRGGSTAVVAAVLEALLTGAAAQGLAQPDVAVPAGRLQGSVVAAQTNLPIDDAIVSIVVAGGGILPANRASAFWHTSRSTRTDANGVYRFDGLAPGRYQLHIRRIGYRSADVDIDLGGAMSLQVSVGLSILPIVLEPLTVRAVAFAPAATPFRSAWDSVARARLITESERRHRFLATDARSLTGADLTEAVTLGETDLFRALQRMPGVSTRDEFTAELWTRGGRWSDTRVTYDGLPLFSPLHAGGTIGGVPPDIVGSAVFHPGVRPAALGEGAAAALELTSKPALQSGFHGAAELSTISARTTLEHGGDGAGPRWVLGARRSYIDLVTKLLGQLQQDSMIPIPYAFIDLSGRVDVPLGSSSAIELSGLWSEDRLGGGVPNLLFGNRGRWGNALVRATLVAPLRGLATRHTIGFSGQRMLVRGMLRRIVRSRRQFHLSSRYAQQSLVPDRRRCIRPDPRRPLERWLRAGVATAALRWKGPQRVCRGGEQHVALVSRWGRHRIPVGRTARADHAAPDAPKRPACRGGNAGCWSALPAARAPGSSTLRGVA